MKETFPYMPLPESKLLQNQEKALWEIIWEKLFKNHLGERRNVHCYMPLPESKLLKNQEEALWEKKLGEAF